MYVPAGFEHCLINRDVLPQATQCNSHHRFANNYWHEHHVTVVKIDSMYVIKFKYNILLHIIMLFAVAVVPRCSKRGALITAYLATNVQIPIKV